MKHICTVLFLLFCLVASAQIPDGYYAAAANQSGSALKSTLHNIVKNHTSLSYSELWNAFYSTDRNPDNNKVWDIYSDNPDGTTAYYFDFGTDQCGNYSAEGDCYNREHSIPKSWFNDATPMYTDLFHIYPTDGWVNNKRGNLPLGEVDNATWTSSNGSKIGPCAVSGYAGAVFEPIDAYKGDLARTYFYFSVCYMDKNLGYEQSMFSGSMLQPWALQMMLRWNEEDPVSQKELDRNNEVYALQHNRNPFIDFPELAEMIFGSDTTQLFLPDGIATFSSPAAWRIYPNPAADFVQVSSRIALPTPMLAQLWSITGQLLCEVEAPESLQLDLTGLSAGVYVLQLTAGARIDNFKIVKNR